MSSFNPTIRKNTLWNLFGSITPMLIGVITIPYLVQKLGIESFGVLTLIWALIGYFSIFDFGIGRALTHMVSTKLVESLDNLSLVATVIKSGCKIMSITGFVGGGVLFVFSESIVVHILNVSNELVEDTISAIKIASVGIPITTLTSGLKGVLEGFEDFKSSSLLRLVLGVLNFLFPVLSVLLFNNSLFYIVISLVLSRFIILVWHVFLLHKKISIRLIIATVKIKKSENLKLLSFGAWMTLSNIISPLLVLTDRFLISNLLGAKFVAYYTVPFDFLIRLLIIPSALTTVLFPRITSLLNKNFDEAITLYKSSLKLILVIMSSICVFFVFGSKLGLTIWLGSDFAEKSWLVCSILAIGIVFNSLAQGPYTLIQAFGKVKTTSMFHFFEFITYIPILYFLIYKYSLTGAAVAWCFRVIVDFILLFFYARNKISHLTVHKV